MQKVPWRLCTEDTKIGGASAGSLIAATYHSGIGSKAATEACLTLAAELRKNGTRGRLKVLLNTCDTLHCSAQQKTLMGDCEAGDSSATNKSYMLHHSAPALHSILQPCTSSYDWLRSTYARPQNPLMCGREAGNSSAANMCLHAHSQECHAPLKLQPYMQRRLQSSFHSELHYCNVRFSFYSLIAKVTERSQEPSVP